MALPAAFTESFLRQLELLKVRARRHFLGTRQGVHLSLKRGHGIEFSDYRKYELGDDPRHIDWSVFARNERLYVKLFHEEQDLSVLLLLDHTASMATPPSDEKWEMARDIALALAYIALMQHDRVLVTVPGDSYSPVYGGVSAIHSMSSFLGKSQVAELAAFKRGVRHAASRMRFPGIAIVVSDFLMPLESIQETVGVLRARNLEIAAVQVLGPNDINPLSDHENVIAVDSETAAEARLSLSAEVREEYDYLLEQHNQRLKEYFFEHQVAYSQAMSTADVADFVVNGLAGKILLQ